MDQDVVTPDMRVWEVIQRHPQTIEVFPSHGCPDMRKGIYALSAKVTKVKWAAKMHKIPVDALLRDLNAAVKPSRQQAA